MRLAYLFTFGTICSIPAMAAELGAQELSLLKRVEDLFLLFREGELRGKQDTLPERH
jgi:hypothetical protein